MIDKHGKYTGFLDESLPLLAYERPTFKQVLHSDTVDEAALECVVTRAGAEVLALRIATSELVQAERELYLTPEQAVAATIEDMRTQLDAAERRLLGEGGE